MATSAPSLFAVEALRKELAGDVIAPDDPGYDDARAVFSTSVDRRPAAIVRPADAGEVARVVELARQSGLELAVRSGGHGGAGHGTTDGGIVLDLGRLRRLELDPEAWTTWAETGLTAGEVTEAAGAHGLAVALGDTRSVGIGGLTLGGGIGYLVRRFGLTIDSLLAAEVVTADGRLVRADDESHPDLFWALRGGGGNFGVATRFLYRLRPLAAVTGGTLVLPAEPAVLAELVAAAEAAPDELTAVVNVLPAPPLPFVPADRHGELVVLASLVYAGAGAHAEEALAPFRALAAPIADTIRPQPYPDLFPREEVGPGLRSVVRSLFAETVDRAAAAALLERLRASRAPLRAVQLRVLGGAAARVPADATAYAHRQARVLAGAAALFARPDEEEEHAAWARETAAVLGADDAAAYVNFLGDEGPERVRAAYPAPTWERLAAVKRRYDPENLFRLNQNVPPAEE